MAVPLPLVSPCALALLLLLLPALVVLLLRPGLARALPTPVASAATAAPLIASGWLLLVVQGCPRLAALLRHGEKTFVGSLGQQPAFARARTVRQRLVLRLHAGAWAFVCIVTRHVGDVAHFWAGTMHAVVVYVISAQPAIEEV